MQTVEGLAADNSALIVSTSKCLDRCKQGPVLLVEKEDGTSVTCVSKDKPLKKPKKDKFGNNIVPTGTLSPVSSVV